MSKVQLTIAITFISSKDNDEEHIMHSKSGYIEIMIIDKVNEFIQKSFQSPLNRYHIGLETSMRGKEFICCCLHLLQYKCHKINFKRVDHI